MSNESRVIVSILTVCLAVLVTASPTSGEEVIAWNDLGMHCMDSDYAVFSILPPFNTLCAQVIGPDGLVSDPAGLNVTYAAVEDPSGSINSSSVGKTDFWEHVSDLCGVDVLPDRGLAGCAMPGPENQPQAMTWDDENRWSWPLENGAREMTWLAAVPSSTETLPSRPSNSMPVTASGSMVR